MLWIGVLTQQMFLSLEILGGFWEPCSDPLPFAWWLAFSGNLECGDEGRKVFFGRLGRLVVLT